MSQLFSTNGFMLEGLQTSCTFNYLAKDLKSRFLLFFMVIFGFVFPLIIIILFYVLLFLLLKKKKDLVYKRIYSFNSEIKYSLAKRIYQPFLLDTKKDLNSSLKKAMNSDRYQKRRNAIKSSEISLNNKKKCYFIKREMKVAKIILMKVFLFCLAWTPYVFVTLIAQFGTNIEYYITPYTTSIPAVFSKTSVIFNALIFTLTQKQCRNYFSKLIFRKKSV